MPALLQRQATRLHGVLAELVRCYQFRDRDQTCELGLTISQCYALDAIATQRGLTTGALAKRLVLKLSSTTRVVDELVARGFVSRTADPRDRRICRVQSTARGRAAAARIRAGLVREYADVLRGVAPASREAVVRAIAHLLAAFQERQRRFQTQPACDTARRRRVHGAAARR